MTGPMVRRSGIWPIECCPVLLARNWRANYAWQMTRDQTLSALARAKPELARRFGVVRLALFGSVVRNQASADSDVDIVVRFDGPATSTRYFGVQFFLEDMLGSPVDLVTEQALRPELKPYIERELVNV
jgi:uncharacterized protein